MIGLPIFSSHQNGFDFLDCVVALHVFIDSRVCFLCNFLQCVVRVDLIWFVNDFSFIFVELFWKFLDSDGYIFKVLNQLLNDLCGVQILTSLSLASHKFVHPVVEVVHISESHLCNLQAECIRIYKGIIIFILIWVDQRLEELFDLLVNLIDFIFDLINHFLLSSCKD